MLLYNWLNNKEAIGMQFLPTKNNIKKIRSNTNKILKQKR